MKLGTQGCEEEDIQLDAVASMGHIQMLEQFSSMREMITTLETAIP